MSTSLLYHGFGLRGYRYLRTEYINGHVYFTVEMNSDQIRCSVCNCRQVVRRGKVERRFRSLPIGNKTVWIILAIQRVWCSACHLVRQVRVNFTDPRYSYTRAFERYALELCRHMTIKDVALHLNVGWDMIKEIQKRYLEKRFSKPKLKQLKKLAIDEISIGAGHRYLTIVLDSGFRRCGLRGRWQRCRCLEAFLAAIEVLWSSRRSSRHRHVSGIHPGGSGKRPSSVGCLRSFPRHQTLQRPAVRSAPTTLQSDRRDRRKSRLSRVPAGCC